LFSPDTPISPINKTDRHDITEPFTVDRTKNASDHIGRTLKKTDPMVTGGYPKNGWYNKKYNSNVP
jgi:hypothetical protein